MIRPYMKYVSCYLVVAIIVMGMIPRVYAGFSPSEVIALSELDRSADLEKIQKILEIRMVRERLDQLGFSQDEIQKRLGQLTDEQIHQLALQIDELRAGGNGEVVIIIVLVIALIIVLFLWLTGRKVVVTK
ncbi:MAG: PA2779 family protein [Proteobacteria bacterium]|nr:PA2779 family protein [Pseudomonadota bacterium]NIS71818.1 PA2779 family protein [Pseudomonadota bacterium]